MIDATSFIPRLRRWNRREPELVARLGGLGLVALIAQYNYLFLSDEPEFSAPLHDPGSPRPLGGVGRRLSGDDALGPAVRIESACSGRPPTSCS